MEAVFIAIFVAAGVAGGQDMGAAQERNAACQEQGFTEAVYVEGSGFDYECK